MVDLKIPAVFMLLFLAFSTNAEAKLYKWVDDQGVTHYSEVMPSGYTGDKMQLDKQGHEVKPEQKQAAKAKPTVEGPSPAVLEQRRHDKALLGSFSNVHEIDLARDRNLQQVNLRTKGIQLRMKTANEDLASYQKEQDSIVKSGKPADKGLQQQISQTMGRIARLKAQLDKSKVEASAIRARYDADKQRYIELTGQQ